MMVELIIFAFYTTIARIQYWFLAPITVFIINFLFIKDQRMLWMAKMLKLHLLLHAQSHLHPSCLEKWKKDLIAKRKRNRERGVRNGFESGSIFFLLLNFNVKDRFWYLILLARLSWGLGNSKILRKDWRLVGSYGYIVYTMQRIWAWLVFCGRDWYEVFDFGSNKWKGWN